MKEIFNEDGHLIYHTKWDDRSSEQVFAHSLIFPKATLSLWKTDVDFQNVYHLVSQGHTLVDEYRCYELWSLAKQLRHKKGAILEVGVWRGGTGVLLAMASGQTNRVYLCDTFSGVVKASERDKVYKGGEHADTTLHDVRQLIDTYNITNVELVKGIFPEESSHLISDSDFKLCHIDVDVYQSAKDIFQWVWPRLLCGGVVVFDDYGFAACEGVTELVHELMRDYSDALMIHNLNGHGILIKIS